MTHFIGAVIIPVDADRDEYLDQVLERYNEGREVPHWITKDEIIAEVRANIESYRTDLYARYLADPDTYARDCFNPKHLEYLSTEFPQRLTWTDDQCYAHGAENFDEIRKDGAGLRTYNPESQWDWWEIGGRWNDIYATRQGEPVTDFYANITATKTALEAGEQVNPHKGEPDAEFPQRLPWYYPHHLVTTDGEWHEAGHTGWFGYRSEDMSAVEWLARAIDLVGDEDPTATVVYIDFHI